MNTLSDCLLVELLRRVSLSKSGFLYALVCKKWLNLSPQSQGAVAIRPNAQLHAREALEQLSLFTSVVSLVLSPGSLYVGHLPRALVIRLASDGHSLRRFAVQGPDTVWPSAAFEGLSSLLSTCQQLRSLELCGQAMACTAFPDSLGGLAQLRKLSLQMDNVGMLPDSIGQLRRLRDLSLQCSSIQSLPETMGQLSSLKTLFLDTPSLEFLPDSVGSLYRLTSLAVASTTLTTLPENLGRLVSLAMLSVSAPRLAALPSALTELRGLISFSLKGCGRLQALPYPMDQLRKLQDIFVQKCPNLRSFPEPLYQLPSLRSVTAGDNLSGFLAGSHMLSFPSLLRQVRVSFATGRALPGSLCSSLPGLQSLCVEHCPFLAILPPDISSLTNLKELRVTDCDLLTALPGSITDLVNLEELSISNSRSFHHLPRNLERLTQLKVLELSSLDALWEVPASLSRMTCLDTVRLEGLGCCTNASEKEM